MKKTRQQVTRRRRMSLAEKYIRDNIIVIATGLVLALIISSVLGVVLLGGRWWVAAIAGVLACLSVEFCHYKGRIR